MRPFLLLSLSVVIILSCNLDQNTGEAEYALKKLHTEVMDIHDEVMPKMSSINKLERQLKQKLKDPEAVKKDTIQQLIYQLDEADDAMMNWMSAFKKPDYANFEAAQKLYASEKEKIIVVRDKMNSTISKAQLFLNRND